MNAPAVKTAGAFHVEEHDLIFLPKKGIIDTSNTERMLL